MNGKSMTERMIFKLMLLIFVVPILGWSFLEPQAEPWSPRKAARERPESVTNLGLRNSLIIDEQEGRYGQAETGLEITYNRVDGIFVQVGLDTKWRSPAKLRLFAHAGYAYKGEAWRYEIGMYRWFDLGQNRLEVGIKNYDLTATEDEWVMPTDENGAAAFFFKEDFRDYYRRSGTSLHLASTLVRHLSLEMAYLLDEHESLKRETNWSLFGGRDKFRENPPADEGKVHSLMAKMVYDTRDDLMEPTSGFWAKATYEKGGDDFGGNFDFQRFLLDFRRYVRLSIYENIDLRLRMGTASGDLPVQLAFDLGGVGSLRGYNFKEFDNFDRLVLGNVEYRLQFGRFAPGYLEENQIIPFYDVGFAWSSDEKDALTAGFDQLTWDRLKSSVGIGLSTGPGDGFRVNLARRLDDRDRPMTVRVRLRRIF
jgi:outer membrane protein assembly factor BamA